MLDTFQWIELKKMSLLEENGDRFCMQPVCKSEQMAVFIRVYLPFKYPWYSEDIEKVWL